MPPYRYCLDKNYAGVLIVWDRSASPPGTHHPPVCRMFGTFQAELPDVAIVYGLVDQPQFWNPVKHQVVFTGCTGKVRRW